MPWTCKLIENPELTEGGNVDTNKREIGDMWYLDLSPEEIKERDYSEYYFANNSHRKPIVVMLPGRHLFCIDCMCYDSARGGYYGGWTVTGSPPNINVEPSINMVGRYHGFLKNGVLSDPL